MKNIWGTDGENAKKNWKEKKKTDQIGMESQSCLLISDVEKYTKNMDSDKQMLKEVSCIKVSGSD